MPITAITIENFKSIREPVRIELKPITLLFGPNSAGKSTFIQALHYAYEIFIRENVDPNRTLLGGDAIDLGGFENFVHKHDKTKVITLGFELDVSHDDIFEDIDWIDEYAFADADFDASEIYSAAIKVHIGWQERPRLPLLTKYEIDINDEEFAKVETSSDGKQVFVSNFNFMNPVFHGFDAEGEVLHFLNKSCVQKDGSISISEKSMAHILENLTPSTLLGDSLLLFREGISLQLLGQNSALPKAGKRIAVSEFDELSTIENQINVLGSLIAGPCEYLRDELYKTLYLGPIREIPGRNFTPDKLPPVGRWAHGLAAWDYLFNANTSFVKLVNQWFAGEKKLNCGYSVKIKEYMELEWSDNTDFSDTLEKHFLDMKLKKPEEIDVQGTNLPSKRRLFLWEEKNQIEVAPQDIGVGISQLLPVVVAALRAQQGFVLVEQPELHIHPSLQIALGDLFIEQIAQRKGVIFILETHSEHLLLRMLRRIRETADKGLPVKHPGFTAGQLAVNYVEKQGDYTTITQLPVDDSGDFTEEWPLGFFEERDEELLY